MANENIKVTVRLQVTGRERSVGEWLHDVYEMAETLGLDVENIGEEVVPSD